jgi:putative transcriptional regulator
MARRSKIIAGLKDAVRYARGERTRGTSYVVKVPPPLDVRAIRQREGLSQKAFAAKYGIQGLKEALAYSRGDKSVGKSRIVRVADRLNVRVIRDRLGMTQKEFALRYGFSLGAVQNWEQGRRRPHGSNRILLTLIDRIPDQIERALQAA